MIMWLRWCVILSMYLCAGCTDGGGDGQRLGSEPVTVPLDGPWSEYSIAPPSDAQNVLLSETPYIYPTQECRLAEELESLPETATRTVGADGQERVCVWNSPTGVAPQGINFNEVGSCDHVFTQAPSWFVHPERVYASDEVLLEDPEYLRELRWAQQEIRTSGCACCHSSAVGSGHTTSWDSDAPAVWTDTISKARLYLLSGMQPEHRDFGAYPPEDNHGASRDSVMVPSSDPRRLRDFFLSEFERRGGDAVDIHEAQEHLDALFGRKSAPARPCIDPYEGLVEGVLVWNDEQGARQVYVQEEGSEIPGFPPNLDRPAGTVWAFRVPFERDAILSGTITLGDLPEGAVQLVPADGTEPEFEPGRRYRLYVTPDVMLLSLANCFIEPV